MRATIVRDDSLVIVEGVPRVVSLDGLPETIHAVQVHGKQAEVEYCNKRHPNDNMPVQRFSVFLRRWEDAG